MRLLCRSTTRSATQEEKHKNRVALCPVSFVAKEKTSFPEFLKRHSLVVQDLWKSTNKTNNSSYRSREFLLYDTLNANPANEKLLSKQFTTHVVLPLFLGPLQTMATCNREIRWGSNSCQGQIQLELQLEHGDRLQFYKPSKQGLGSTLVSNLQFGIIL
jgi:hypothetical protein